MTVVYHDEENGLDKRIIALDHEVLECCDCGSKECLIRVPELSSEIWCVTCAEAETWE